MDALAVNFAGPIVSVIQVVLFLVAVIAEVAAFLHCLLQRPDAFKAVGTLSKGAWLALTGGAVFVTLIISAGPTGILGLIGLIAAAVYLLDVRPAIRDVAGGSPGW